MALMTKINLVNGQTAERSKSEHEGPQINRHTLNGHFEGMKI